MRGIFLFLIAGALAASQSWIAMGLGGAVNTAPNGAVEFKYQLGAKLFAAAVLPVDESFASMKSLRFRVRADHDTTLGVLLSERKPGGGNYAALFSSPANVWQQIELTPADFELSDGPNDPKDADGKLDLDQVEGVAIFDFANFIAASAPGAHSISLDNFEVRTTAPPQIAIDTFDRGFLLWMTPGTMTLKLVPETGPLGEPSLKATYSQTTEPFAAVVRRVGNLDLSKAKRLTFDIASENEATILIALETKQGPRYNLTIYPPAGRKIFHVDLSLDDFERENGGSEKFAPSRWKSIAVADISGGNAQNTLWLGNLRAK